MSVARTDEPRTFWWELMEMMRKFLLVGLFVIVAAGTIIQISLGTLFSAAFLLVQVQAAPCTCPLDLTRPLDLTSCECAGRRSYRLF